jgi:N4-gp56 family major capsid protein
VASELTTSADVIAPEVWADAVGPHILGQSVFAPLADTDDTLVASPGERISTPKWNYIGDAEDLTEGVAMETDKLTMTDSWVGIKEAGKALELTDKATLTAIASPNAEAQRQLGVSVARKIDTDLRVAAGAVIVEDEANDVKASSPLTLDASGFGLGWSVLVDAFSLLGDEYDPTDFAALVIHSKQFATIMKDPLWLNAAALGQATALTRGTIGSIGTIPVIMTDRLPAIADVDAVAGGAQPGHQALLIRKHALKLFYKRRPIVETDRDILKRTNIITTNVHYGAARVDDRGVVAIKVRD